MILSSDFLLRILGKYATENVLIHITDANTRILASTDMQRIGENSNTAQYIIQSLRPAVIENTNIISGIGKSAGDLVVYGTPFFFEEEPCGTVIVKGPVSVAVQQGNIIRAALETASDYQRYDQSLGNNLSNLSSIAIMMLSDKAEEQKIVSMMNRIEMDPTLLRCAICINFIHHQTNYFNINLSLGYQSSIEKIMEDAAARLKKSKYLNSQDIVHIYDRNTIVILKSFIPVTNLSQIYISLDVICQEFETILSDFTSFSFSMAYGNLYAQVTSLKKSLNEAVRTIDIGRRIQPERHLFVLENILFYNVCHFLHPQIVDKMLLPIIQKLKRKDGSLPADLIDTMEVFVDSSMSLSATSEKLFLHRNTISVRLDKFKSITGLDPVSSFSDAFIIKIVAAYIKLHQE